MSMMLFPVLNHAFVALGVFVTGLMRMKSPVGRAVGVIEDEIASVEIRRGASDYVSCCRRPIKTLQAEGT